MRPGAATVGLAVCVVFTGVYCQDLVFDEYITLEDDEYLDDPDDRFDRVSDGDEQDLVVIDENGEGDGRTNEAYNVEGCENA